jgi:glycerol-3-phosphate dehydrogenase
LKKRKTIDVLVIGGGINGAGVARDLAGRGLSVILCEKNDLASATSSASTKLIHGGLRYLEHYEFRLVREALREREVLLRSASHIIWPMRFILPHHKELRPWWMIRMGLFLYDYLGKRKSLPASQGISFMGTVIGQPLKRDYKRGFSYSDCWVDDARLVVLTALDAREKGAEILTRTECIALEKHPDNTGWLATLRDNLTETETIVHAQLVVNAAGPWVNKVLGLADESIAKHKVRWVKGSHIIVPRLYKGDHAYILQNEDKRVVFAIPYEGEYTLIGTTDIEYHGDLEQVRIEIEEVEYLCTAVNKYFRQQIKPEQVQWTYSGVRPLMDDGGNNASDVTRDYTLDLLDYKSAPILNIYGGKITTFRRLSEQAADKVVASLGRGTGAWTENAFLPGGDGGGANFETFLKTLRREYNWLPESLAARYARAYGSRAREFLRGFKRLPDLGANLGDDIYEAEIAYLVNTEWALTIEDLLWRRSKLGLHVSEDTQQNIQALLKDLLVKKEG